jgi:hypothetical protein
MFNEHQMQNSKVCTNIMKTKDFKQQKYNFTKLGTVHITLTTAILGSVIEVHNTKVLYQQHENKKPQALIGFHKTWYSAQHINLSLLKTSFKEHQKFCVNILRVPQISSNNHRHSQNVVHCMTHNLSKTIFFDNQAHEVLYPYHKHKMSAIKSCLRCSNSKTNQL